MVTRRDRVFFRSIRRGLYFHPKGRRVRKSFGYVGNTVWQLGCLLELPAAAVHGRVLYLADYEAYDIYEWARLIQHDFGAPPVRQVPVAVLSALAKIGDGLKRMGVHEPPLTSYRLRNLTTDTIFPMEPLRACVVTCPTTSRTQPAKRSHGSETTPGSRPLLR